MRVDRSTVRGQVVSSYGSVAVPAPAASAERFVGSSSIDSFRRQSSARAVPSKGTGGGLPLDTVPASPPDPTTEQIRAKAEALLPNAQDCDPPQPLIPLERCPQANLPGLGTAYYVFGNMYLRTTKGKWQQLGENVSIPTI